MAPYGHEPAGGGSEGDNKRPHTFHQMDIDKATELFRKKLEGSLDKKQGFQPSVKGGLPPHLLRQRVENDSLSNNHDHSQGTATPPDACPSANHARQQQCQPRSTTDSPQVYPARDGQGIALRRTFPRQALPGPSSPFVQKSRPVDTHDQCTPAVGLTASRWSGVPPQTQQQLRNERSPLRDDLYASVLTGGVRLSVNAHDDWAPFNCNDGEQYHHAEIPEQDKTNKGKWRPKHSCDLQSQDLPDSVASSLHFNVSDESLYEEGALRPKDIRNTVGGDLDLLPKVHGEGFYNKHQWDEYPDETNYSTWRPTYCQLWVKEVESERWPVAVFLNLKDMPHAECDVQPRNGWLMAPIDYPDTHIDPDDAKRAQDRAASSRRLHATSALKIKSDYTKLKRRVDEREGEVKWEPTHNPFPIILPVKQAAGYSGQPTPPSTQSYINRSPVLEAEPPIHFPERTVHHPIFGEIIHLPRTFAPRRPPTYLKIACFLRPAEKIDIPQILDIYNWEVSHGTQALDTHPLCLEDMERVFQQCRIAETPIIVAVAGTPAEAKARKESTAAPHGRYDGFQQWAQKPEKDKVIGFAYVSIVAPGLAGDVHYNVGRFVGRVHIYVAYECRRKGIGRALLQRMTIFCSRHAGYYAGEYEWHDPERRPTYDEAAYNSRGYTRIIIEFASRAKDDPDTLWLSRFLDAENFTYITTQDKARKVGYGEAGKLVDCVVCQHDCQDLDNMRENVRPLT